MHAYFNILAENGIESHKEQVFYRKERKALALQKNGRSQTRI